MTSEHTIDSDMGLDKITMPRAGDFTIHNHCPRQVSSIVKCECCYVEVESIPVTVTGLEGVSVIERDGRIFIFANGLSLQSHA